MTEYKTDIALSSEKKHIDDILIPPVYVPPIRAGSGVRFGYTKYERLIKRNPRDKRELLSILEACEYVGMGRAKFRNWADVIGAVVKKGRRVLFDKKIIDKAIRSDGERA